LFAFLEVVIVMMMIMDGDYDCRMMTKWCLTSGCGFMLWAARLV